MSSIVDQKTKRCTKCGIDYPATTEFFYARKERKGGLRSKCRSCDREQIHKWRLDNPIKVKQKSKEWYAKNAHKSKADHHQWVKKNRDRVREYSRKRYAANAEKLRRQRREWRARNPEREKETARKRRAKNPAKLRAKEHRRRILKMQSEGQFTSADIKKLYANQRGRCWYCQVELGDDYHIDHRIPLTRGGTNHPSNLVLACPPCNLSKHNKLPDEWCGRLL